MNIKSMLLGTAAALVAVSGARAADAVVMVEPEPVDYVRVCDVYGTGFFYIPGTETCLKIGGYVRMRIQGNDQEYNDDPDESSFRYAPGSNGNVNDVVGRTGDEYRVGTRVRARLDFDAREETELGTLRAKIRLEATNASGGGSGGTGGAGYTAEEAYLQLGGLTIGFLDSVWTADDGGISDGLYTDTDWASGDFQANRISYTYAASGFSGTLSVEDDGDGDFIPDVIGKLAYTGGFGGAYVMGVFDEDSSETSDFRLGYGPNNSGGVYQFGSNEGTNAGDEAFVVKAGIELKNLIAEESSFKIEGHYAFDPSNYAQVGNVGRYRYANGNDFNSGLGFNGGRANFYSEYQIGAGYQQQFGKIFAAVSGVYGETFDNAAIFTDLDGVGLDNSFVTADIGSADYYGIAGNLGYNITSNFSVLGEVSYVDIDLPSGIDDFDQTRGFLEFKRSF